MGTDVEARVEEILAAASEIRPGRRKPGRPPKCLNLGVGFGSEAKSRRGQQDAEYAFLAGLHLLKHRDIFPELLRLTGAVRDGDGPDAEVYPDHERWHFGILVELGRLMRQYSDGRELALKWAIDICRMQPMPTTKRAVAWLRGNRLQRDKPGTVGSLGQAIIKAIDDYKAGRPETPHDTIATTLRLVAELYDTDEDDQEGG